MENPFVIKAYESKELFCDREEELQLMLRNCLNQTDMTMVSQRRLGKTGLILRLFDELKDTHCDIQPFISTSSLLATSMTSSNCFRRQHCGRFSRRPPLASGF